MKAWVESIGRSCLQFVAEVGKLTFFSILILQWALRPPYRFHLFAEQFVAVGNQSTFIVCLTAFFSGMVSAIQIYYGFRVIDASGLVGPTVALGLARELGPVFTAIVVTGRAGARMAAQLGTMRISEQIDAMDVMAVSSIQYLVVPRVLAGFLALPLLTVIFIFVGNLGAYSVGVFILEIDPVLFYAHLQEYMQIRDLWQGLIKSVVFGGLFSIIGTYKGYYVSGGAEAVGRSTTEAVVNTIVLVLISDYFLTVVIRAFLY